MKEYNLNSIARRCADSYVQALKQGHTAAVIRTKTKDLTGLAQCISKRLKGHVDVLLVESATTTELIIKKRFDVTYRYTGKRH